MHPAPPRTTFATHGEEYGDPPRRWRRVAALVLSWITIIAAFGMLAPVIAASGLPPDPRDLPPESANEAIWTYLYYAASKGEAKRERAWEVVCVGGEPELDPDDLSDMVWEAYDRIGGAEGVDINQLDEEAITTGDTTTVPVMYSATAPRQGRQEQFDLTVTTRAEGEAWCVVDAALTPTPPDLVPVAVTGDYFDAIDFGDPASAESLQCDSYIGMTPEEIAQITLPIISGADNMVYRDPLEYEAQWTVTGSGTDIVRLGHDYVEVGEYNERIVHASFVITVETGGSVENACVASVDLMIAVGTGN
jgi:hypothetical protein